ncbi:MAG: hypothetical protein ACYSR5_11925 [Planctomycetota bacterium]
MPRKRILAGLFETSVLSGSKKKSRSENRLCRDEQADNSANWPTAREMARNSGNSILFILFIIVMFLVFATINSKTRLLLQYKFQSYSLLLPGKLKEDGAENGIDIDRRESY